MCQQGITRKVWIPGPRGLKPPPRNDTQWVLELITPGTPAGYNAKTPKAARTGDGRRWLQPPFLGISGQGDTISGGFNRRSVFRCQVRPVPTPVAEADRTSSFSGSGVLGYGG